MWYDNEFTVSVLSHTAHIALLISAKERNPCWNFRSLFSYFNSFFVVVDAVAAVIIAIVAARIKAVQISTHISEFD